MFSHGIFHVGTAQHHASLDGIGARNHPYDNLSNAYWGEYPPILVGQYPVEREQATCFYVYERIGRSGGAVRVDPFETLQQKCWKHLSNLPLLNQGGILMKQNNRSDLVLDLFDAYYDRVYAFARKSAGPSIAEDVAQEVFIRLMQHPRLEELTLSISYLLKIAHNLLRRRHSRGTRLNEILNEHVRPEKQRRHDEDLPRPVAADNSALERAYGRLSHEEQDAIRMIVCEGRSYAHAARSLDVSVTTINNWKHRGLSKLRKHMEAEQAIGSELVAASNDEEVSFERKNIREFVEQPRLKRA